MAENWNNPADRAAIVARWVKSIRAETSRIDHRPRRRRLPDVTRASMVLPGQSHADAARLFRGAIYWAAIYGDAALTLLRGIRGETLVHVRRSRRARSLARRAPLN